MKLTETPLLDDESMAVLTVAYRARTATVEQLASLVEPELVPRLGATLDALALAGFLERLGDDLVLQSPYSAFIAISQARAERLYAETERTVTFMSALPQLIRNWDLGEAQPGQEHPLVATVVHGRELRWPTLRRHLAEEGPARPSWVLPDPDPAMLDELGATGSRVLLSHGAAIAGAEVRALAELPGWFYVDENLAALPVTWGEEDPSSILLVRTPPVIAALAAVFDALWRRALPAAADAHGWEPVVGLLAQGLTDEGIAHSLGLDVRTVRRRVADAMDELGAVSRFTLGAAWERRDSASR